VAASLCRRGIRLWLHDATHQGLLQCGRVSVDAESARSREGPNESVASMWPRLCRRGIGATRETTRDIVQLQCGRVSVDAESSAMSRSRASSWSFNVAASRSTRNLTPRRPSAVFLLALQCGRVSVDAESHRVLRSGSRATPTSFNVAASLSTRNLYGAHWAPHDIQLAPMCAASLSTRIRPLAKPFVTNLRVAFRAFVDTSYPRHHRSSSR
jgi:hypothetical protein